MSSDHGIAGDAMMINQSSQSAIVNWDGFSIGGGNFVQFKNRDGATLSHLVGRGVPNIDGNLSGTVGAGEIIIVGEAVRGSAGSVWVAYNTVISAVTFSIYTRRSVKLAFRSCHIDGCIIPFQMNGKIRSAMQKGTQLVIFLKGFSAVLRNLGQP